MTADKGDCVVEVANAFSDESLCTLQLPRSSTVLEVKRRVQAAQGISIFRQRLIISPVGPEVEGNEVLADLPGLRLQLIRLEYADDDANRVGHLLRAAGEGAAPEVERLLRLPLRPDCSQAEDGRTALVFASQRGHLEVAQLLLEARGRQGQGEAGWCHGLDVGVSGGSPGGGAAALRGRGRQGQGEAG